MTEIPAKGVRGYLLYNPITDRHFFRIYDAQDRKKYIDYEIGAQEIEIEIVTDRVSLYDDNLLDWSSKVLRCPSSNVPQPSEVCPQDKSEKG